REAQVVPGIDLPREVEEAGEEAGGQQQQLGAAGAPAGVSRGRRRQSGFSGRHPRPLLRISSSSTENLKHTTASRVIMLRSMAPSSLDLRKRRASRVALYGSV